MTADATAPPAEPPPPGLPPDGFVSFLGLLGAVFVVFGAIQLATSDWVGISNVIIGLAAMSWAGHGLRINRTVRETHEHLVEMHRTRETHVAERTAELELRLQALRFDLSEVLPFMELMAPVHDGINGGDTERARVARIKAALAQPSPQTSPEQSST